MIPPRLFRTAMFFTPFIVLIGVISLQIRYDEILSERFYVRAPVHKSIMPASIVRNLTFGFSAILADYYWITAVQDFSKWDSRDVYFPEYFRIIHALDPKFEYPYIFGILTVPDKKAPESLDWLADITQKGIQQFPENWRIPFSAATQFHIVAKDNKRAIHFLALAAAMPSATDVVHRAYAIFLMRDASDYKKSRALFTTILDTADNDETRRIASERIELLDLFEGLEQLIKNYKKAYGVYPASIDQLMEKTQIELPNNAKALIEKFTPTIDQSTGKILLR